MNAPASSPSTFPLVDIRGLRKRYGSNEVLKGVDLQINRSEVVSIIGKSGSGKSTLLRCINGLESFQEGQLLVHGQPLQADNAQSLRELRKNVGMIFQSFNLFPHLTVGRNVMLAPTLVTSQPKDLARQNAERLLARVGLAEKFDAMPDQLSGGQQQRVAIARALAMDPEILLCDEVTSALDPELVGEPVLVALELNGGRPIRPRVPLHRQRRHRATQWPACTFPAMHWPGPDRPWAFFAPCYLPGACSLATCSSRPCPTSPSPGPHCWPACSRAWPRCAPAPARPWPACCRPAPWPRPAARWA